MQQVTAALELIKEYWGYIVFIAGVIGVERAPIKISPITWILKGFRSLIGITQINIRLDDIEKNQSCKIVISEKMNSYEERLSKIESLLEQQCEEQRNGRVEAIRSRVLEFDNRCRMGYTPTMEEFSNILNMIYDYEKICEEYDIKNGRMKDADRFLREYYNHLSLHGGFNSEPQSNKKD